MSADVRRYLDILTESNSLSEGVYDPHIFKAVFIIGPPGAGKSTTARKLLDNTGLRRINIDDFSEMMIKKGQSQLGSLSPEQWEQAWQKSQSRKELALHGRLGLVIDSTGSDSKRILSAATQLENIGYEIMLILVTASFDTVLQRQKQREQEQIKKWGTGRKVDQGYAKLVYDSVRSNIKTYENKFGNIQWLGMPPAEYEITSVVADFSRLSRKQWPTIAERSNIRFIGINTDETESSNLSFAESIVERFLNTPPSDSEALRWIEKQKKSKIEPKDVDKTLYAEYDLNDKLKENAMDTQFFRKYADLIKEAEENMKKMSPNELAKISDAALDDAYHYGRSTPGNNFGWLSNVESAKAAAQLIYAGETDVEKIADAIHDGWNITAMADYENRLNLDTPTPDEKKAKRYALAQKSYHDLPEDEKEKDRVVARALLKAILRK